MQEKAPDAVYSPEDLTPRELEILQHIVYGRSNLEIASALSLSVKTVEWHRINLMRKLEVHKVADLVRCAIRYHLVESNGENP